MLTTPSAQTQRGFFAGTIFLFLLAVSLRIHAAPATEILPPGFRPVPPGVHALVGARVVVKPGEVLTNATIIIRDGFIESVAANAAVPADARVWDMKGLTVYAGFIDPYLTLAPAGDEKSSDKSELNLRGGATGFFGVHPQESDSGPIAGPDYEVAVIKPERRVAATFHPGPRALEELRELGFTAGNVVPEKGVIRGTSAFVALSDAEPNRAIIKPDVFQHIVFDLVHRKEDVYPASLMGIIAAVRQAFFDAQYYVLDREDYAKNPQNRARLDYNAGLEALRPAVEKKMRVVFEPQDALMVDRVARMSHELNLDFCVLSSGEEWRRPGARQSRGSPVHRAAEFPRAAQNAGRRRLAAGHAGRTARLGLGVGKPRRAPPARPRSSR